MSSRSPTRADSGLNDPEDGLPQDWSTGTFRIASRSPSRLGPGRYTEGPSVTS
jgi:hypothetical protein